MIHPGKTMSLALGFVRGEARRISIATGAVALALALGATGGDASGGRTIVARGGDQFVPNAKVMATFRFSPGHISVASGETVTFQNDTDEPHTLSIVDEGDVPTSADEVFNCGGPGTVCDEIFTLFSGAPPDATYVDAGGGPGLDTRLDTQFVLPGDSVSTEVTAPSGSTLHFICAIHAWMIGTLDVK